MKGHESFIIYTLTTPKIYQNLNVSKVRQNRLPERLTKISGNKDSHSLSLSHRTIFLGRRATGTEISGLVPRRSRHPRDVPGLRHRGDVHGLAVVPIHDLVHHRRSVRSSAVHLGTQVVVLVRRHLHVTEHGLVAEALTGRSRARLGPVLLKLQRSDVAEVVVARER